MEIIIPIITIICFLAILLGIFGTVVPFLPGTPLIFVAGLVLAVLNNFQRISVNTVVWLGVIALVSYLVNLLLVARGVKKSATGNTGLLFAAIGAILGLAVLNFIGFFLGLLAGFIIGELVAGTLPERIPSLAISVLGSFLAGLVFQFASALIMAGIIVWDYLR